MAIRAEGLGKAYRLAAPGAAHDTLRDQLAAGFGALLGGRGPTRSPARPFWALRDVSFEIRQGENVGILGLNGAGKSTLLKLLSRVSHPTAGRAQIHGRLGSLLEVGTGFHAELTGRENIFLYGAILGMSGAEINAKFEAIVAFAEVAGFVDTPVKRYSSGMYARLAFAVAAHLEPDVLLLDEVLSVGDLPFQRKCLAFAKSLQARGATILFVSHNMFSIKAMCERVIYLKAGRIAFDGPTDQGISLYEADGRLADVPWIAPPDGAWPVSITEAAILSEDGAPQTVFGHGERLRLRFGFTACPSSPPPAFVVAFIRSDGVGCCSYSTELDEVRLDLGRGQGAVDLLTPPLPLTAEMYRIEILARAPGFQKLLCAQTAGAFHIRDAVLDTHFGVFHQPGAWEVRGQAPAEAAERGMAL